MCKKKVLCFLVQISTFQTYFTNPKLKLMATCFNNHLLDLYLCKSALGPWIYGVLSIWCYKLAFLGVTVLGNIDIITSRLFFAFKGILMISNVALSQITHFWVNIFSQKFWWCKEKYSLHVCLRPSCHLEEEETFVGAKLVGVRIFFYILLNLDIHTFPGVKNLNQWKN